MTKTTRDKWLPALVLALLVHAVLIVGFYLNANKDKLAPSTSHNENLNAHLAASPQDDKKAATDSSENKQVVGEITDLERASGALMTEQQNVFKNNAESNPERQDEREDTPAKDILNASNNNSTLSQRLKREQKNRTVNLNEIKLNNSRDNTSHQTAEDNTFATKELNKSNPLTTEASHPALLDRDAPKPTNLKGIDDSYDKTKAETEEVNEKLSAAISEVKRRNQQKIDEERHQQAYARALDNVKPIENSSNSTLTNKVATTNPVAPDDSSINQPVEN